MQYLIFVSTGTNVKPSSGFLSLPTPKSVEENENSESAVDSNDMEDAISIHVDGHNIHTVD
jgi:hypothetical protein